MMTIGIWGDAADVVIDPYSQVMVGQVRLVVNLFASVAIRLPGAFGVGQPGPPPREREAPQVRVTQSKVLDPETAPEPTLSPSPPPVATLVTENERRSGSAKSKGFR